MAAPMGKRNVSHSKTEEFVLCRWDSLSTIMMCADQCTRPLIEFQVLCSIYNRLQWFSHDIFPETKIQSFRKLSNYLWTETKGTIHTLSSKMEKNSSDTTSRAIVVRKGNQAGDFSTPRTREK